MAPGPPSVLAIAEMNLEEYPAFRLGRRSKRPELRYTRTRTDGAGRTLEQTWVVRGVEGLGLPGPFEQDLYVALLVLFTEQGLPADGRIRFTRNRLAQVMGHSNSGRGYELLEQGLSRLAGATVHTEHAFYQPGAIGPTGERSGPAERLSLDFHILEEVRVYERRAAVLAGGDASDADGASGDATLRAEPVRVERARPLELSVARLGQPLVQSYERRYTKGLDATFYFTLERPLAKRLYRYLDKVRNGRGGFEIGLLNLADVLGLEYRYPSDVKDGLAEAHAELQATGYLAGAGYAPLAGGPRAGEKVVYAVQPAFDRRPRRRAGTLPDAGTDGRPAAPLTLLPSAGPPLSLEPLLLPDGREGREGQEGSEGQKRREAQEGSEGQKRREGPEMSPLQAELEEVGVSPARAVALVAAHPAAHIAACLAYVRELRRRPGASPIKNPAGFLTRAIEQGYALPAPPSSPAPSPAPASPAAPAPPVAPTPPAVSEVPVAPAAPAVSEPAAPVPASQAHAPAAGAGADDEVSRAGDADDSPWGRLSAALKERLSAATYAAWVRPAAPAPDGENAGENAPAGGGAGRLTILVPSAFALDRWRRPPLAPALQEAASALGLDVRLEQKPAAAE